MLDQNTDRMWYVIGAVIVGAAIIFLVNSSFPQLFASVGDTFKDKTEDIAGTVELIRADDINLYNASRVEHTGINGYMTDREARYVDPLVNSRSFFLSVQPGEKYTITRSDKRNSRFGLAYSIDRPIKRGVKLYHESSEFQNELSMGEITVPKDMNYLYLYLYDTLAESSDLPDIVIKQIK